MRNIRTIDLFKINENLGNCSNKKVRCAYMLKTQKTKINPRLDQDLTYIAIGISVMLPKHVSVLDMADTGQSEYLLEKTALHISSYAHHRNSLKKRFCCN